MLIETKKLIYKLLNNTIDEINDKNFNFVNDHEIKYKLKNVQNALKLNKSVKTINLKNKSIYDYRIFLDGLKLNKTVKKLKLNYNSVIDIEILSSILLQNRTIKSIKLKFIGENNFSQNKIIDYTYLQQTLSFNNVITKIKIVNKNKKSLYNVYNDINQNISILMSTVLCNNITKISLKSFYIKYNDLLKILKSNKLTKLKLWKCVVYHNFEDYNLLLYIDTNKKIIYNQKYDIPLKEIVFYKDYINYLKSKYNKVLLNLKSIENSDDDSDLEYDDKNSEFNSESETENSDYSSYDESDKEYNEE